MKVTKPRTVQGRPPEGCQPIYLRDRPEVMQKVAKKGKGGMGARRDEPEPMAREIRSEQREPTNKQDRPGDAKPPTRRAIFRNVLNPKMEQKVQTGAVSRIFS